MSVRFISVDFGWCHWYAKASIFVNNGFTAELISVETCNLIPQITPQVVFGNELVLGDAIYNPRRTEKDRQRFHLPQTPIFVGMQVYARWRAK